MKKILVFWLYFLSSTNSAHASVLKVGPYLGAHRARHQKHCGIDDTKLANLRTASCWGYHVGAFARLSLLSFYIQPEIILTNTSIQHSKENKASFLRLTKLDMPTMIGCSFFRTVRIQTGPVFNVLLRTKKKSDNTQLHYKRPPVRWQAGLGVDIWKIIIDLKYETNIRRERGKTARIPTNDRHESWILSIGVNIL